MSGPAGASSPREVVTLSLRINGEIGDKLFEEMTAMLDEHAKRIMGEFADYAAQQAISGFDLHGAVIGFEDGAGI